MVVTNRVYWRNLPVGVLGPRGASVLLVSTIIAFPFSDRFWSDEFLSDFLPRSQDCSRAASPHPLMYLSASACFQEIPLKYVKGWWHVVGECPD